MPLVLVFPKIAFTDVPHVLVVIQTAFIDEPPLGISPNCIFRRATCVGTYPNGIYRRLLLHHQNFDDGVAVGFETLFNLNRLTRRQPKTI